MKSRGRVLHFKFETAFLANSPEFGGNKLAAIQFVPKFLIFSRASVMRLDKHAVVSPPDLIERIAKSS